MSGVVSGGWGFVIAAYSITAALLFAYGASLYARLSRLKR